MKIFNTETELAQASLIEGQYVETYGKVSKYDGLGSRFLVQSTGYTPIIGTDVTLVNGLVAKKLLNINPDFYATTVNLSSAISTLNSSITSVSNSVTAETVARTAADTNLSNRIDSLQTKIKLISNLLFTVGAGGSYASLSVAVEDVYNKYTPNGAHHYSVELRILNGTVISSTLRIFGIDASWIKVTSVSGLGVDVNCSSSSFDVVDGRKVFIYGIDCKLPEIHTVFKAVGSTTNTVGCMVDRGTLYIQAGSGFTNFGINLNAFLSTINASNSVLTMASEYALYSYSSNIFSPNLVIGGSSILGYAKGIYLESSIVDAWGLMAQYCVDGAIEWCSNSKLNIENGDLKYRLTGNAIVSQSGSTINASNTDCRLDGVMPRSTDIDVFSGGTVIAIGSISGSSQTSNTLTAKGIIFR